MDPSFNILCVKLKNECIPGRNDALWIHLCKNSCNFVVEFVCCFAVFDIRNVPFFQSKFRKVMQDKNIAENDQKQLMERIQEIKQT